MQGLWSSAATFYQKAAEQFQETLNEIVSLETQGRELAHVIHAIIHTPCIVVSVVASPHISDNWYSQDAEMNKNMGGADGSDNRELDVYKNLLEVCPLSLL